MYKYIVYDGQAPNASQVRSSGLLSPRSSCVSFGSPVGKSLELQERW